ncbi:MAG: sulfur relay protein DsrC [Gammaproteobacteria bacterium]|nr:sulfur relay protein DsrC [Gammaproteobacteria bacterium]MDC3385948.1 sulfur relay protein DsrC [Gammaproteobacteria bacterium]
MKTYKDLKDFISKKIDEGEMFLSLDIKPNFEDTPDYWETDLENLFTSPKK